MPIRRLGEYHALILHFASYQLHLYLPIIGCLGLWTSMYAVVVQIYQMDPFQKQLLKHTPGTYLISNT